MRVLTRIGSLALHDAAGLVAVDLVESGGLVGLAEVDLAIDSGHVVVALPLKFIVAVGAALLVTFHT